MKKLSMLILLVASSAALAGGTADVTKGVVDAARAARGGQAAIQAGAVTAATARSLKAVVGSIMESTTPTDIGFFRAEMDKVNIPAEMRSKLVAAYQTTVVDKGCLDAHLPPAAYANFSKVIDKVVAIHIQKQTTVDGLAKIAKESNILIGPNVTAEQATKESEAADAELVSETSMIVAGYEQVFPNKDRAATNIALSSLANQCGLNRNFASRLALAP